MSLEADGFFSLIDKSLITLHLRAQDDKDAIRSLARLLVEHGRVSNDFIEEVVQREVQFPTGLPTPGIKLALPHTGSSHVIASAIAIGVLDRPIDFRLMGSPDQSVAVQIVFLLGLRERDSQPTILKSIMQLIQNTGLLEQMVSASSAEAIYQALREAAGAS
jgi:galactitol PTS system EIIA component